MVEHSPKILASKEKSTTTIKMKLVPFFEITKSCFIEYPFKNLV